MYVCMYARMYVCILFQDVAMFLFILQNYKHHKDQTVHRAAEGPVFVKSILWNPDADLQQHYAYTIWLSHTKRTDLWIRQPFNDIL